MSHTARSQRPRGRKRVRSEEDPATPQHGEKAAATDAPAEPAKKKYKRRQKRKADVTQGDGAAQLDPEEQERRRVQKELRDLAIKLRTEGKEYKPQKYKRKLYVESGAGKARRERKKEKNEHKSRVWVVVLPIFWKQREDEMEAVLAAAKKVEGLLAALAVRVVVDTNNDYKPGERMKHWEELKVPVRIEIGPQDVKKGSCVVAVAGEAGTVAQKTTVRMSHKLVKKVRQLLVSAGAPVQAPAEKSKEGGEGGEADEGEGGEEGEEGEGAKAEAASGSDAEGSDWSDDEEDEEGAAASRGADGEAGASGAKVDVNGDEMDDFDLEVDAEEDVLTMTKKEVAKKRRQDDRSKLKEKKKQAKQAVAGTGAKALPSWEEEEAKKTKKKTKVVVF